MVFQGYPFLRINRKKVTNERMLLVQYTKEDYIKDTKEHIQLVRQFMISFAEQLAYRSLMHDRTKLENPEMDIFIKYTPELDNCVYGSEEYKKHLKKVQVALSHHYTHNSHHPEHYPDGINGMDLLDIVEMFCDWLASSLRHQGGNIYRSIEVNKNRFEYSNDLKDILVNSIEIFKNKMEETQVV